MLADRSAVTFCNSSYRVIICIVSESRYFIIFWPCIKHWHSHSVIVGNYNVYVFPKWRGPCADWISCCSRIPCCSCRVLHLLRSKFSYYIFLSAGFNRSVLYSSCSSVCICSDRSAVDISVFLYACTKSFTDTSCTCDRIVMSDISDSQNISDHSVTVTVNFIYIFFDIVFYHSSLKFSTLICIKSYIICIFIEVQCCHVQFSRGTVWRLSVEPYQRFVLICHFRSGRIIWRWLSAVRSSSTRSNWQCHYRRHCD